MPTKKPLSFEDVHRFLKTLFAEDLHASTNPLFLHAPSWLNPLVSDFRPYPHLDFPQFKCGLSGQRER